MMIYLPCPNWTGILLGIVLGIIIVILAAKLITGRSK